MTTVRRYTTPNRLARFVNTPDGLTPAEAVARAEANLEELRPPRLERIDAIQAELGGRAPAAHLYRLAGELAGIAGVFGLRALGHAAYSLCELLDRLRLAKAWSAAAVGVHLDGLRLLRSVTGEVTTDAAAVLAGLDKVVARIAEGR